MRFMEVNKLENGTEATPTVSETVDKLANDGDALYSGVIRSYPTPGVSRASATTNTEETGTLIENSFYLFPALS